MQPSRNSIVQVPLAAAVTCTGSILTRKQPKQCFGYGIQPAEPGTQHDGRGFGWQHRAATDPVERFARREENPMTRAMITPAILAATLGLAIVPATAQDDEFPVVKVVETDQFGVYLVDADGRPLY